MRGVSDYARWANPTYLQPAFASLYEPFRNDLPIFLRCLTREGFARLKKNNVETL